MKYCLLFYSVCEDFVQCRTPYRDEHLELVEAAYKRGDIVLAGAYGDPVGGAALLFYGESTDVAERFAREDPYVASGLVTAWRVQPWHVVVGQHSTR